MQVISESTIYCATIYYVIIYLLLLHYIVNCCTVNCTFTDILYLWLLVLPTNMPDHSPGGLLPVYNLFLGNIRSDKCFYNTKHIT